jgi:pyruvate kinase
VQLPLETIPIVQEDIIRRTNRAGKLSITATEMLESMTNSPRPTRAEATDVANAVLDGTDAVMLSGETAAGRYPVRAVEVMDAICREAEKGRSFFAGPPEDHQHVAFLTNEAPYPSAIAQAAVEVAGNLGIETIVGFTESGSTARLISKYRPEARIMAFTVDPRTYRQMALYWGVAPRRMDRRDDTDEMIAGAEALLLAEGVVRSGEGVVMVAGIPPNQGATTNLLKIHEVGASGGGLKTRPQ